jgi:hypothetical protein
MNEQNLHTRLEAERLPQPTKFARRIGLVKKIKTSEEVRQGEFQPGS